MSDEFSFFFLDCEMLASHTIYWNDLIKYSFQNGKFEKLPGFS